MELFAIPENSGRQMFIILTTPEISTRTQPKRPVACVIGKTGAANAGFMVGWHLQFAVLKIIAFPGGDETQSIHLVVE
jgi:hypothetical protein